MRTMTLLCCLRLAAHRLAALRFAVLGLAAAGLAGCASANADLTASISEPAAASSSATKPKPGRARNDDARNANAKDDDWWKEGGVTREKVSSMCWMKYEKGRRDLSLDKRADLVNACVEQTMAEHPQR